MKARNIIDAKVMEAVAPQMKVIEKNINNFLDIFQNLSLPFKRKKLFELIRFAIDNYSEKNLHRATIFKLDFNLDKSKIDDKYYEKFLEMFNPDSIPVQRYYRAHYPFIIIPREYREILFPIVDITVQCQKAVETFPNHDERQILEYLKENAIAFVENQLQARIKRISPGGPPLPVDDNKASKAIRERGNPVVSKESSPPAAQQQEVQEPDKEKKGRPEKNG